MARRRSKREKSADSTRSRTMKRRWAEARRFSELHGTKVSLKRRTSIFSLTNKSIEDAATIFKGKERLPSGRRGTEARRPTSFRIRLISPDGRVRESDTLKLGGLGPGGIRGGLHIADLQRGIRDAIFGTLRASADEYEDVEVLDDGTLTVDGETWTVEIEHDTADPFEQFEIDI